jgi:hypothetical protein
MRSLFTIIDTARDGQRPSADESYHAMLVLASLLTMASSDAGAMAYDLLDPAARQRLAEEGHRRCQAAMAVAPEAYLGTNVPGNPTNDRLRRIAKAVLAHVEAQSDTVR